MQRILQSQNVFTSFIDLIHVFGSKIDDDLVGQKVVRGYVSEGKKLEQSSFLYGSFPLK